MKSYILAVATLLIISGCEENGGGNNSSSPSISYTDRETATNNIKNFTNADWLYEQYFGEYGLAKEFKPNVIDELKRVANGFALSYAQGKETTSEIGEFQTLILSLQMSGIFNSMVTSLEQDFTNQKLDDNLSDYTDIDIFVPNTVHSGTSTELDEYLLDENKSLNPIALYETEQIYTVKKYNLPYPLDGKYPKYISLGRDMKGGSSNKTKPKSHASKISSWIQEPGMFLYKPDGVGHIAMFTKYWNSKVTQDTAPEIVEAMPKVGVVRLYGSRKVSDWQNRYNNVLSYAYIDGRKYDKGVSSLNNQIRRRIAKCAIDRVKDSYNWNFFDKYDPTSTYCSQLIWGCYQANVKDKYGKKVDLDVDKGSIVYPQDLARHLQTHIINASIKL